MADCYLSVAWLICSVIRFASCDTADVLTTTLQRVLVVPAVHLLQVRLIMAAQQHCHHLPASRATNMQDGTVRTAKQKESNLTARNCSLWGKLTWLGDNIYFFWGGEGGGGGQKKMKSTFLPNAPR